MTSRSAVSADGCRPGALALALIASLALPARSTAQPSDLVELTWNAPSTCPAADDVRARIRALAGTASPTGAPLRATAKITRRTGGNFYLELVVTMDGLVGERSLEARACDDLAGATAVNIALLLKDAQLRAASFESPNDNAKAGPVSLPVAAEPPPVRAILQAPLLAWSLGPMPSPSIGVSLAGGVAIDPWILVAKATLWLPHTLDSERAETGATIDRLGVGLHVCRAFPFGPFGLAPCASLALEQLWARGVGPYVRSEDARATGLAVGLGIQARYRLAGWLNLLGGAELKLQAARPRLSIEGVGSFAQLGMLAGELTLGAEWIL
jgi:hypothetical protein